MFYCSWKVKSVYIHYAARSHYRNFEVALLENLIENGAAICCSLQKQLLASSSSSSTFKSQCEKVADTTTYYVAVWVFPMGRMHNWKALLLFTFSQSPCSSTACRMIVCSWKHVWNKPCVPKYVHKTFELARCRGIIGRAKEDDMRERRKQRGS